MLELDSHTIRSRSQIGSSGKKELSRYFHSALVNEFEKGAYVTRFWEADRWTMLWLE